MCANGNTCDHCDEGWGLAEERLELLTKCYELAQLGGNPAIVMLIRRECPEAVRWLEAKKMKEAV